MKQPPSERTDAPAQSALSLPITRHMFTGRTRAHPDGYARVARTCTEDELGRNSTQLRGAAAWYPATEILQIRGSDPKSEHWNSEGRVQG